MYGPTGPTVAHQSDMNELHEISENSESETDVQSSGKGSWRECRMTVSTNSESDASTIPECNEGDSLQSSTEQYQLSLGLEHQQLEEVVYSNQQTAGQSHMESPRQHMESPRQHMESPRQHMESPRQHLDSPRQRLESPRQYVEPASNEDFRLSRDESDIYFHELDGNRNLEFRRNDEMRMSDSSNFSENNIGNFERKGTFRNSDNSNVSSIDEGTCVGDSKRSSLSDSSHCDESFPGKHFQNGRDLSGSHMDFYKSDLQTSSQLSSESGINSEVTSSNQSDASQQSVDLTGIPLTPQDIALKVLADVGNKREILENVQRQNLVQTQQTSQVMRQIFNSANSVPVNSSYQNGGSFAGQNNSQTFRSFQPTGKVPPPVPQKPKINRSANVQNSANQGLQNTQNNFSSVGNNFSSMGIKNSNFSQLPIGMNLRRQVEANIPRQYLNRRSPSSPGSPSTPVQSQQSSNSPTFSTFHPRGQQMISRPESTTSISSHCSTGSSVLSVIHRPTNHKAPSPSNDYTMHNGPNTAYQSMFNSDTHLSNSNNPSTQEFEGSSRLISAKQNPAFQGEVPQNSESPSNMDKKPPPGSTRGNSPKSILNSSPSCLRSNSKGKKPQKRVSFSDSEPSDLESPSTCGPNRVSPVVGHKPGPNRVSPVNSAVVNQKPEDFLSPLQRLNNMINKPAGYSGNSNNNYGSDSVPSAKSNFYMNGNLKGGVVIDSRNTQFPNGHISHNAPVVGPTHALGGSSINGPNSTTSDQIKMLYSGQRTASKSHVLQSSKC